MKKTQLQKAGDSCGIGVCVCVCTCARACIHVHMYIVSLSVLSLWLRSALPRLTFSGDFVELCVELC